MTETFDIAGYTRISVDDELDRDNVSIENQKAIIQDFVAHKFPGSTLTFYEDRDRSGYTFEQREGYQAMRRGLMSHQYDILVVKDFSRFSRRNSRGLVELEDLRDAGVRIISIGDNIDFPNDDDWLKIQFQFLINEMPVTDTSKKVKNVIKRRQADGKWICAAPYGYIVNKRQEFEIVPTEADVVRTIFRLYNEEGWGYKKIANYLTDQGVPTPRMAERDRKEAAGEEYSRTVKPVWAIVTVQGILDNDFYIGTLRQGKYTRRKINGKDVRRDEEEQIVIENHHQAIIDYRTFATTRALREKRSTSHYRGVKKYDNTYSGFLVCGDCGAPMFSLSRSDLKSAYTCGTYHRRGLKGCTSHHIRADKLDELLKAYVRQVMDHSADMLERLNEDLAREQEDVAETEKSADRLAEVLSDLQEELKVTKRQRIRDLMKHPDQEDILEQTYDELEGDLQKRIEGIGHQIELLSDKRNTIIRVNRAARTAMEVFRDILNKERLERRDLELIIRKIKVYEDRLEIQLQADVDSILRSGTLSEGAAEEAAVAAMAEVPEGTVNFKPGMGHISPVTIVQEAKQHPDKVFHANVISDGDPLEIYTSREGEVIFKKYSLLGGVEDFATELCETMSRSTGSVCAVTDRDTVIAVAGGSKRELMGKRITPELERIMEGRKIYQYTGDGQPLPVTEGSDALLTAVAAPILAEGDLLGLVLFITSDGAAVTGDTEYKLAQTIAAFLGRHMES
ncbi:stage V sporulation T C-terminal domain-containing protein [Oscillibacter valericigenes]|uniref:stage V sporulation T C-terminal domain-containing protein n=1 Tax=Oscillibacter valericigenes TaxID=351091 RepID=UPI00195DB11B|nr:stage V sporulation T C-terminal domain-containing protein [Oscillibacter valericigenes]MBM6910145.1 recombinase family protein [Oscillibacter valericigenes]